MAAQPKTPRHTTGVHWWRDQFARLVITIVGAVIAALILAFVIPALANSGNSGETPTESTDAPAEGTDTPADSEAPTEEPAPADAEPAAEGG